MTYHTIFGPVPSRRLGISLGVDLVPHKVCSLNCIYCEAGKSTTLTNIRDNYIHSDLIIEELAHYLAGKPQLDVITFSGQGEPLLNAGFGKVVDFIKDNYDYKLVLITNSTLLYDQSVRDEVKRVDLILPSLDGATEASFKKINRPVSDLKVQDIIEGLAAFKSGFQGEMWLEIFIVSGINDTEEELEQLSQAVQYISPDRIQLNTLDRPGVVDWIKPAEFETMEKIKVFLSKTGIPVEIIAKFKVKKEIKRADGDIAEMILKTIRRRPCTVQDLVTFSGVPETEIDRVIQHLTDEKKIEPFDEKRGVFYRLK